MTDKIRVVMDVVQRRPACVLLQAAMGGDHAFVSAVFAADSWLITPNENMRLVEATKEQWKEIARCSHY